jgi:competence protein ComEC
MLGFSLSLLLACVAVVWSPGAAPGWWLLFVCLLGLLLLVWRNAPGGVMAGTLLGAVLATVSVSFHLTGPDPGASGIQRVEGRVVEQVGGSDTVSRFVLVTDPSMNAPAVPDRIRVSWRDPGVRPLSGERWSLALRFTSPAPDVLPGGFDGARWQFRNGFGASARVVGHRPAIRLEAGRTGLDRLRDGIALRIRDALAGRPESALIRGVTVGDRSAFTDSQWQVLNATGTTHLVAISGLHIGLIAALGFLIGRRVAASGIRSVPANVAGAVGGFLPAFFYAALAGFALPTVRALVMFGILALLLFLRRRVPPGAGLALALAAVLLFDPMAVMDAGFYLSFALVAFVLLVVAAGDRPGRLAAFARVQWVTGLAVLPILLLLFGDGPPVGPLANAIAVPVFSLLVVPVSLLGVALDLLAADSAAATAWWLAARGIEGLWPLLEWLGRAPTLSGAGIVPGAIVAVGLIAILALVLPGARLPRTALVLALLPAVAGVRHGQGLVLDHWTLRDDGHVWVVQSDDERLVRVEASRSALRRDLLDWLSTLAGDPETTLVLEPRGRTGPSSLSPVVSSWPAGRILMADAGRAGSPRARHCHGIEGDNWRLTASPRPDGAGRECVLEWHDEAGRLLLADDGVGWSAADNDWRLVRADWDDVRGLRPEAEGAVEVRLRRPYWWRR